MEFGDCTESHSDVDFIVGHPIPSSGEYCGERAHLHVVWLFQKNGGCQGYALLVSLSCRSRQDDVHSNDPLLDGLWNDDIVSAHSGGVAEMPTPSTLSFWR